MSNVVTFPGQIAELKRLEAEGARLEAECRAVGWSRQARHLADFVRQVRARAAEIEARLTGRPVRLQLRRAKGFRLQEVSKRANGLAAIKVDRSTLWGNPFAVGKFAPPDFHIVKDAAEAVQLFRHYAPLDADFVAKARAQLGGKNLACWCPLPAPGEPDICHAAVLLEIANG